jgi:hypothetical protein
MPHIGVAPSRPSLDHTGNELPILDGWAGSRRRALLQIKGNERARAFFRAPSRVADVAPCASTRPALIHNVAWVV